MDRLPGSWTEGGFIAAAYTARHASSAPANPTASSSRHRICATTPASLQRPITRARNYLQAARPGPHEARPAPSPARHQARAATKPGPPPSRGRHQAGAATKPGPPPSPARHQAGAATSRGRHQARPATKPGPPAVAPTRLINPGCALPEKCHTPQITSNTCPIWCGHPIELVFDLGPSEPHSSPKNPLGSRARPGAARGSVSPGLRSQRVRGVDERR